MAARDMPRRLPFLLFVGSGRFRAGTVISASPEAAILKTLLQAILQAAAQPVFQAVLGALLRAVLQAFPWG